MAAARGSVAVGRRQALGRRRADRGRGRADLARAAARRADASIGVESSSSRTTWPAWTSWIDELVLMISRWARAGSASALTSSGIT